jgi:riboflavin kinase/FMN adenylyltransferase
MKVYFGMPEGKLKGRLAIGVFDGVHKGHLAILRKADLVLTFDSLPEHVIAPGYAPPALCSLEAKLEQLKAAGIQAAMVVRFDRRFAALSAEAFAAKLEKLGVSEIVVGADFVFGAHAAGNAEFLRERGFKVATVKPVLVAGRPVSSTRIRSAVADGDMKLAARLLGRPFTLRGEVIKGAQMGRKLGYPTANLDLDHEVKPKPGVWGAKARMLPAGPWKPALMNLGTRPSFKGKTFLCELHLLDFRGNLYGKKLEAEPMLFLRAEKRFESIEALTTQIRLDESRFRRSRAFLSAARYSGARLGQRR